MVLSVDPLALTKLHAGLERLVILSLEKGSSAAPLVKGWVGQKVANLCWHIPFVCNICMQIASCSCFKNQRLIASSMALSSTATIATVAARVGVGP